MSDEANNTTTLFLDEVRELHARFDAVSERVTKLEEQKRGASSDMMQDIMLWLAVAYVASMLLPGIVQLFTRVTQCER